MVFDVYILNLCSDVLANTYSLEVVMSPILLFLVPQY